MPLPYPNSMGVLQPSGEITNEAHPGLIFTHLFDGYLNDFTDLDNREIKNLKLNFMEYCHGGTSEWRKIHEDILERQIQLIESHGGIWWIITNKETSPFLTGIGIDHPLENGFLWHPVYPAPYVPGSGLKGLLRSWFESDVNQMDAKDRSALLKTLFGSDSKDPAQATEDFSNGGLVFIDALPAGTWKVQEQIITPHMGKYYEKGQTNPGRWDTVPADWHEPNPIPFMALGHISFLIGIFPSSTTEAAGQDVMRRIQEHMNAALEQLGLGAKTALGFGRFEYDQAATEKLHNHIQARQKEREKSRHLATLSEEERAIEQVVEALHSSSNLEDWKPGQSQFTEQLQPLLDTAEQWDDPLLLNQLVCKVIIPWIEKTGNKNYWQGGKAKGKKRWPKIGQAYASRQC